MKTGDRIKQRREALGISVEDVARQLGKHRATIYRYESNDIETLPTDVLEPLAIVLHTTPAALMGWEDFQDTVGKNSPAPAEPEANAKWQKLHSNFEKLNDAGQDRLVEYSDFLISKEEYQKTSMQSYNNPRSRNSTSTIMNTPRKKPAK